MRCYDCAVGGRSSEAAGVCHGCGRAICLDHSVLQHLPQHYRISDGMIGSKVRCKLDQARLVCHECEKSLDCCDQSARTA